MTGEIKQRIEGVKDTKKIANAMFLIASTKLEKARNELKNTEPYFNAIRTEIKRIFRTLKDIESKYFYPVNMNNYKDGDYGILVITSERGLAGSYNRNVIKKTLKLLEYQNPKLFVMGNRGRQYFIKRNIPIEDFNYNVEYPTIGLAREITLKLLERYDTGEIKKIFVIYTDGEIAKSTRLLPFRRDYFSEESKKLEKPVKHNFEFFPSIEEVLDSIVDSYISGFIYGALVSSFCAEQNARMTAMSSARKNADDILEKLLLEYNRARQDLITQEITEISAGAKAQKRKKY